MPGGREQTGTYKKRGAKKMKNMDYSKLAAAANIKGGCGHSDAEIAATGSLIGICMIVLFAVIILFCCRGF